MNNFEKELREERRRIESEAELAAKHAEEWQLTVESRRIESMNRQILEKRRLARELFGNKVEPLKTVVDGLINDLGSAQWGSGNFGLAFLDLTFEEDGYNSDYRRLPALLPQRESHAGRFLASWTVGRIHVAPFFSIANNLRYDNLFFRIFGDYARKEFWTTDLSFKQDYYKQGDATLEYFEVNLKMRADESLFFSVRERSSASSRNDSKLALEGYKEISHDTDWPRGPSFHGWYLFDSTVSTTKTEIKDLLKRDFLRGTHTRGVVCFNAPNYLTFGYTGGG